MWLGLAGLSIAYVVIISGERYYRYISQAVILGIAALGVVRHRALLVTWIGAATIALATLVMSGQARLTTFGIDFVALDPALCPRGIARNAAGSGGDRARALALADMAGTAAPNLDTRPRDNRPQRRVRDRLLRPPGSNGKPEGVVVRGVRIPRTLTTPLRLEAGATGIRLIVGYGPIIGLGVVLDAGSRICVRSLTVASFPPRSP